MHINVNKSDGRIQLSPSETYPNEMKWTSVRAYGNVVGKLLSLLGLATKARIDTYEGYLNNKSFAKMLTRNPKSEKINPESYKRKIQQNVFLFTEISRNVNLSSKLNNFFKTGKISHLQSLGSIDYRDMFVVLSSY